MFQPKRFASALAAAVLLAGINAASAAVFEHDSFQQGVAYPVNHNHDAILGVTGSPSTLTGQEGSATATSVLTNGTNGAGDFSDLGTQVDVLSNGNTVTYNFTSPQNISAINTYSEWRDNGRVQQDYTILTSNNNGASYTTLATVAYHPSGNGGPIDAAVQLTGGAPNALIASGVTNVEFSFPSVQNGYVGYTEFAVYTTPEPASLVLFGVAAVGLAFAARRQMTRTNLTKIAVVLAVLVCCTAPSLAATISGFDPTFETPAESSNSYNYNATAAYTSTSGIINPPSAFGAAAAPQGSQVGFLQTNTGDSHYNGVTNGLITGSIDSLIVGRTYELTGLEAARGGQVGSAAFSVTVGGHLVGSEAPTSSSSYTSFTTNTFIATAASESLLLLSTGPTDSTTFVDQLAVSQIAPEPSSILLCGLGAIGLFVAARRRRQA